MDGDGDGDGGMGVWSGDDLRHRRWTTTSSRRRPLPPLSTSGLSLEAVLVLITRFKKAASRAGTQLMQKTGQVERTLDPDFEEQESRYRT